MISEIIAAINERFKNQLFAKYPDAGIFGLTTPIMRVTGTERKLIPAVVDLSGEATYVGIDDIHPIILYHKNNSVTAVQTTSGGVGSSIGNVIDTFNNSLIAYYDRKKVKMMPDQLAFFIQANFPDTARLEPFRNIQIFFQGVILNSAQIFAAEYGNTNGDQLDPGKSMLSVNYQIISTFDRSCFKDCLF